MRNHQKPFLARKQIEILDVPGPKLLFPVGDAAMEANPCEAAEIIVVVDRVKVRLASRPLDGYGADHLLIFDESRRGGPVRQQQAVDAEVSVGGEVAIIPAVQIGNAAVLLLLFDAVVVPLPDEAALQPLIGPVKLLIIRQASRAVAHGMAVLTVDMGLVSLVLGQGDLLQGLQAGVHGGIHVCDLRLKIPFIMDQAGRIHAPDGFRFLFEVYAKAGFISQGPHDDGGVVVVSRHHPHCPVHIGGLPLRIVGDPVVDMGPLKAVALQIRLVDHIQAVLVAVVVNALQGRIMGETDRVDVVFLHHQNVIQQHLGVYGAAALGRIVVMVHAVDKNRFAVYQEIAVLKLDPAEAGAVAHLMAAPLLFSIGKRQLIKGRGLRSPGADLLKLRLDGKLLLQSLEAALCRRASIRSHKLPAKRSTGLGNSDLCRKTSVPVGIVQVAVDPAVCDSHGRKGI